VSNSLAYLATPYSKWKLGLEAAFIEASKLAARLLVSGIKVYSPIAHTHPLAYYGALDLLDLSIWLPFDEAMMERADVLIVAHMDGWQESKGIAHEIVFFEREGKPIFDLDPETLVMTKRNKNRHPDDRMSLGIKDMPKHPGKLGPMIGETRNHFADGHFEHRFEPDGKRAGE
jgi:hypothetical protein